MSKKQNTKNPINLFAEVEYEGQVQKILSISDFYGFTTIAPVEVKKSDKIKEIIEADPWQNKDKNNNLPLCPAEEKVALLRTYFESQSKPQLPFSFCQIKKGLRPKEIRLDLDMIGSPKAITDGLIIFTLWTILQELKIECTLFLNCFGDKDSLQSFTKETIHYFRKHLSDICPACRQAFKKDPLAPFTCKNAKCAEIIESAPKAMDFLTEDSRTNFAEVLDLVETLDIAYQIDSTLMNNHVLSSGTLFEFRSENNVVLAQGGRYDYLSKKTGLSRKMPAVGGSLLIKNVTGAAKFKPAKKRTAPFGYFVQLGFDARGKSLLILETLRKMKLSIEHSLARDGLTSQLAAADKSKAEHALIVGQREVIENSIIVRNIQSRSQSTVKIADLATYIKNLKNR